jgi:hypothetical protein
MTESLWDILPCEIQKYIREVSSASLLQETFKKNREWYFLRRASIKKLRPDYDGKGYRVGDRVLIKQTSRLTYGTISSVSYLHDYYCRIDLLNNKRLYYYPHRNKDYKKAVNNIILLDSWQCCMCHLCQLQSHSSETLCNYCLIK